MIGHGGTGINIVYRYRVYRYGHDWGMGRGIGMMGVSLFVLDREGDKS